MHWVDQAHVMVDNEGTQTLCGRQYRPDANRGNEKRQQCQECARLLAVALLKRDKK